MSGRLRRAVVPLLLLACLAGGARAATPAQVQDATALYGAGLLQGVGTNADGTPVYALDDTLTREQATVLLVRLTGLAASGAVHPFSDIAGRWSEAEIAAAYAAGYTNGTDTETFSPARTVTQREFLTMVLRALGYADAMPDSAIARAAEIGLPVVAEDGPFTRGAAAEVCLAALGTPLSGETDEEDGQALTLADRLVAAGALDSAAAARLGLGAGAGLDATAIFAQCADAVVYVAVYDVNGHLLQSGSGFFLSSDGLLATNYHVIENAAAVSAQVKTSDGTRYAVTGVYDYDAAHDVCLLQVEAREGGFAYLRQAEQLPQAGAAVYAISSPLGIQNCISAGVVSNNVQWDNGTPYLINTAPISHGSSGGALLDSAGRVVGLTMGAYEAGNSLYLAIPVSELGRLSTTTLHTIASCVIGAEDSTEPDEAEEPDEPFYMGTTVPDYGAITGAECLFSEADDGTLAPGFIAGVNGYRYAYDAAAFVTYRSWLTGLDWTLTGTETDEKGDFSYFYTAPGYRLTLVHSYSEDQLWIRFTAA